MIRLRIQDFGEWLTVSKEERHRRKRVRVLSKLYEFGFEIKQGKNILVTSYGSRSHSAATLLWDEQKMCYFVEFYSLKDIGNGDYVKDKFIGRISEKTLLGFWEGIYSFHRLIDIKQRELRDEERIAEIDQSLGEEKIVKGEQK